MKIVVGTDEDDIIMAASVLYCQGYKEDIADMVLEGLKVKIIEAKSVTIGKRLQHTEYQEVKIK